MQAKIIFILVTVFILQSNILGSDSNIPTYWKLELPDPKKFGKDIVNAKLINEHGKNYFDLGNNRREPTNLEPIGKDGKIDDKINKDFDAKIRIGSNLKPDTSKPTETKTGNVTTIVSYLSNSTGPYDYYVYSPTNHRDDVPINWEIDSTQPTEFRVEDKSITILFSIRKIEN